MTREELLKKIDFEKRWLYDCGIFGPDVDIAFHAIKNSVIEALEQEDILEKIRAEIEMYEADCRLQGGTDECEKCNSNVFGSIYWIIDKYKAESEDRE